MKMLIQTMTSVLLPLMVTGCIQDAWNDWQSLGPSAGPSTGGESTTTGWPDAPPTTSGGIQTVTGLGVTSEPEGTSTSTSTSTTTAAEENEPPVIESFAFEPPGHVSEAGPALLHIAVSDDAVKVRLKLNG